MQVISSVKSFQQLGNCTVIEGYLKVVLIDDPGLSNVTFDQLSFPNLREITEYMIIYRIKGLRTLRNIFPKLSTIRGAVLVRNYALVVFENADLDELGLVALNYIGRGSVFIQKNARLCYLDSIDWDKITQMGVAVQNSIRDNREGNCDNQCPFNCSSFYSNKYGREVQMCWTVNDCQQILPPVCDVSASQQRGDCCNELCLNDCYGVARNNCLICRHVHYQGACMQTCPQFTFNLHKRRCLTEAECRSYSGRASASKAHNGFCVSECPTQWMTDAKDPHKCVRCSGPCPKVCTETATGNYIIDSVANAQKLSGCTIINGSLEILIGTNLGDQFTKVFDQSLQNIEEVTHYVKVFRSHALISLNFLKNLKIIGGDHLASGEYALIVIDNRNLQELFDLVGYASLKIRNPNAKVSFHFNPRLCLKKIDSFVGELKRGSPGWQFMPNDTHDISRSTNGDRIACDVSKLKLHITAVQANQAFVEWDVFAPENMDYRSLLGYVLFYREAPYQNMTKYEGRDACGEDAWTQIDIAPDKLLFDLEDLHPARQYAIYVTTYTIASERQGTQSDIVYFTTFPKQPARPEAVRTVSLGSSSIEIHWQIPSQPNGHIVFYNVRWYKNHGANKPRPLHNYCLNRCSCNASQTVKLPTKLSKTEQGGAILMENDIQELVYTKYTAARTVPELELEHSSPAILLDRSLTTAAPALFNATDIDDSASSSDISDTTTSTVPPLFVKYKRFQERTVKLENLDRFSEYVVMVEACHDESLQTSLNSYDACSEEVRVYPITLAEKGADDIPSESVQVRFNGTDQRYVRISWQDPDKPNSIIVTIDIEYEAENGGKVMKECIPRIVNQSGQMKNANQTHHLLDFQALHTGNYSFRLRASSLAGNGSWTSPVYLFIDPPVTPTTIVPMV